MAKKVGVILSGCGVNDGAEIAAGREPTVNEPAVLSSIIQMLLSDQP